jgi:hypothetical protein
MKELIHTTSFASNTKSTDMKKRQGISEYGYINPDGKSLPPEYLIRITSMRNKCTVVSPIQEPLKMKSTSKWEPFVPVSALGNQLTQLISGGKRSLITRAQSRRIWTGSSPMQLAINLQFNAVKDPFMEVTEPVRLLQSMALPSDPSKGRGFDVAGAVSSAAGMNLLEATNKLVDTAPLLIPPGPTPFTVEGMLDMGDAGMYEDAEKQTAIAGGLKGGDIIIVEWGRLVTFYNVIIQEVSPTIFNMPGISGDSMKASVDIMFETYEMMTVESLQKAFDKQLWTKNAKSFNTVAELGNQKS